MTGAMSARTRARRCRRITGRGQRVHGPREVCSSRLPRRPRKWITSSRPNRRSVSRCRDSSGGHCEGCATRPPVAHPIGSADRISAPCAPCKVCARSRTRYRDARREFILPVRHSRAGCSTAPAVTDGDPGSSRSAGRFVRPSRGHHPRIMLGAHDNRGPDVLHNTHHVKGDVGAVGPVAQVFGQDLFASVGVQRYRF